MYSGPTQGYMVKIGGVRYHFKIQRTLHKAITTSYSRDTTDTHLLCLLIGAGHLWWRVMDMLGGRGWPLALGPQNYVDNDRKGGGNPLWVTLPSMPTGIPSWWSMESKLVFHTKTC